MEYYNETSKQIIVAVVFGNNCGTDNANVYFWRGNAKYRMGRTWEAKQDLGTALKLAEKTNDTLLKDAAEKKNRLINTLLEKRK